MNTDLLPARLRSKIDTSGSCWLWTAALYPNGYGQYHNGVSGVGRTTLLAHRVVYESLVGPIPQSLHLDHLCRVHACVNPAHLEPVTCQENNLRGVSPAALNAVKTHCPKGHEYAGDNLYHRPDRLGRLCRVCRAETMERYYARHGLRAAS